MSGDNLAIALFLWALAVGFILEGRREKGWQRWRSLHQSKSYFSRLRCAEMGHHHHVNGPYLLRYAQESAWGEDARRVDNGAQVRRVAHLALHSGPSVGFGGYYQRHCT